MRIVMSILLVLALQTPVCGMAKQQRFTYFANLPGALADLFVDFLKRLNANNQGTSIEEHQHPLIPTGLALCCMRKQD